MTLIEPKEILNDLKTNATRRKRKTLDLLHELLEKQSTSDELDFSIATIGRLSAESGGPSPQAIRNKGGSDYRRLIEVWAAFLGKSTKKPASKGSRNKVSNSDKDILNCIGDPALRAVVGTIIAERNRYRNELRVLKSQTELTIDRRPRKPLADQSLEVLPSFTRFLNQVEQDALSHAVSESLFTARDWKVLTNGRVKDQNGRHLYKPGYVVAIQKILMESNGSL